MGKESEVWDSGSRAGEFAQAFHTVPATIGSGSRMRLAQSDAANWALHRAGRADVYSVPGFAAAHLTARDRLTWAYQMTAVKDGTGLVDSGFLDAVKSLQHFPDGLRDGLGAREGVERPVDDHVTAQPPDHQISSCWIQHSMSLLAKRG